MKTFFSALFGFVFSLFVEGFSRIIISFFHKQEFFFFGIDSLPSSSWVFIIYIVSMISTWLGVMLSLSIADPKSKKAYSIVSVFIILWIIFEMLSSYRMVPLWYLFTFPLTSTAGLIAAKFTYKPISSKNETSFI